MIYVTNAGIQCFALDGSIDSRCSCADCTIKASIVRLIKGKPKATSDYTTTQLEEKGLIGLYRFPDSPGKDENQKLMEDALIENRKMIDNALMGKLHRPNRPKRIYR